LTKSLFGVGNGAMKELVLYQCPFNNPASSTPVGAGNALENRREKPSLLERSVLKKGSKTN